MTICEWCGHEHAITALCTKRPKWSRRGFLALMGAAAVGAAADPASLLLPQPEMSAWVVTLNMTWDDASGTLAMPYGTWKAKS